MSASFSLSKLARLFKAANAGQTIQIDQSGDPQVVPLPNRNVLFNGDMRIAQRGTTYSLTSSVAYGSLDRWAFQQATSADGTANQISVTDLPGFQNAMRFGRNSGSALANEIRAIQVLESTDCIPLQGKTVTLSFYAKAGSNFSAGSNHLKVYLAYGTGIDQSSVNFQSGAWTGQTSIINTNQAITTNWVRYSFTGTVPNNATQLGVRFAYTPSGTAGADDRVSITGVQLERGNFASDFEFLPYGVSLARCQRFTNVATLWVGNSSAYTVMPIWMRSIPTITGGGAGFTSTATTSSTLACYQTTAASQTLTLVSEL